MYIKPIYRYFIVLFFLVGSAISSDEILNQVVALVADRPITQIELDEEISRISKDKNFRRDRRNLKSQALDQLIHREIVEKTLEEEFLNVNDTQVDDYIKREMQSVGMTSMSQFENALRQEKGISLKDYRETIRDRIKVENVMQLRVNTPSPTDQQVQKWYNKNRSQLGKKYKVRIIRMRYNPNDLQDELRINKQMKEARAAALQDFAAAATKYSDHPTRGNGGYMGWFLPHELNQAEGKEVASMLFQVQPGKISNIFVANRAYYILKVERAITPSLDDVRELATNYVASENRAEAFAQWLREERKRVAIQIFLKGYQKP